MIERVLDNWLDRANERSYQVPFCHALTAEGYRVVHLSRHTGMEMGKDVLAVAPDGVPCAFQLKRPRGKKLGMNEYRSDVQPQLYDLAFGTIVHPSIDSSIPHRSFLVVNGELEEEVIRSIDDFNRLGQPERRLQTIVRGDLFEKFRRLQSDFWPADVGDLKSLLDLYINDGRGCLPRAQLASVLKGALPFETEKGEAPSSRTASRALAAAAVLCSLSLNSFTQADNHAAEFEAWTMYFGCLLALAEKWQLQEEVWLPELKLALHSMVRALSRLCDELMSRTTFLEGQSFLDPWVCRVRFTYLLSLAALYALWRDSPLTLDQEAVPADTDGHGPFLRRFCEQHQDKLQIWGEYAIPQAFVHYLYYRQRDASVTPDYFLGRIIDGLATANGPSAGRSLTDIYRGPEDALPQLWQVDDAAPALPVTAPSFTIEALFQLFVRTNLKASAKILWPAVSKVVHASFTPGPTWNYYLWYSEKGVTRQAYPAPYQQWRDMQTTARESAGAGLPSLLRRFPIQFLALLLVYPHRWSSSGVRWVTTQVLGNAGW